jgi:hypothetical protein
VVGQIVQGQWPAGVDEAADAVGRNLGEYPGGGRGRVDNGDRPWRIGGAVHHRCRGCRLIRCRGGKGAGAEALQKLVELGLVG